MAYANVCTINTVVTKNKQKKITILKCIMMCCVLSKRKYMSSGCHSSIIVLWNRLLFF